MLTAAEAQKMGERFLLGKFSKGKVAFSKAELSTDEAITFYQLEGCLKVPLRNPGSRFFIRNRPYSFKMRIRASDGAILRYELE